MKCHYQFNHITLFAFQDISAESVKKKRRTTKKPHSRAIVGATLEVIQKRRTEKPEVRDAAREAALRWVSFFKLSLFLFGIGCTYHWKFSITFFVTCSEIKERIKKTKDEKKAKKAEVTAKTQKVQGKGVPKGAAPKGPKLGGGGGKRWKTFLL